MQILVIGSEVKRCVSVLICYVWIYVGLRKQQSDSFDLIFFHGFYQARFMKEPFEPVIDFDANFHQLHA